TASSEVFAADINFGKCSSQIESWQHKYIAPGQVKTGPSTGNLGDLKFPGGFDGGMGCSK
ncbi:MAG: hypothetical protein MUF85_01955, partial [Patescibacteria group bacterium]|nr:hypothetical protein [Patescibacteria group bacterium]